MLFLLFGRVAGETWPQALVELEPLERVQRRTGEQIEDFAAMVQILDIPVQRLMEPAFTDDTEQMIAVPKISCPDRPPLRAVLFCHADG